MLIRITQIGITQACATVQRAPRAWLRSQPLRPIFGPAEGKELRGIITAPNTQQDADGRELIYVYGRRLHEVMMFRETAHTISNLPQVMRDYAELWQAADKIVYSKTLDMVSSTRTRIEREFDPEAVRRMKARAGGDITLGGPELAAQAIMAKFVDEYHLFVHPSWLEEANGPSPTVSA